MRPELALVMEGFREEMSKMAAEEPSDLDRYGGYAGQGAALGVMGGVLGGATAYGLSGGNLGATALGGLGGAAAGGLLGVGAHHADKKIDAAMNRLRPESVMAARDNMAGAAPALGALGLGTLGAAGGALAGSPLGPVGAAVGGVGGGLLGGAAGYASGRGTKHYVRENSAAERERRKKE